MNQQQIDMVSAQVDAFLNFDLKSLIVERYPSQDLRNVNIGQMNATSFLTCCNRMIKQFKAEIEEGNGIFLPFQYNFQNEFGNGQLPNDLSQFIANVRAGNFPQSIQFLNRLVYYQITNGFWDKSKAKIHNLRGLQVTALEEELNLLADKLEKDMSVFDDLKNTIQGQIEELTNLKNIKEKELTQITNNLAVSNQESTQISELLNKSISTNEKIIAILESANEKLESFKESSEENEDKIQESRKVISELISEVQNNIKQFGKKQILFENYLKEVEGKKGFFDERNKYLTDLIGREVGASLFETFQQRKKELKPSVNFWKWAVPVMTLITIIGIYAIFSDVFGLLPINGEEGWRVFALRSLKSLPLFVILYFTIHQYGKERYFKEEYAFKSAVALTIKAYSDLIVSQDKKDEMILNSVTGVYKSPILSGKKEKLLPTKEVADLLKTVTDATSDVAKKVKS